VGGRKDGGGDPGGVYKDLPGRLDHAFSEAAGDADVNGVAEKGAERRRRAQTARQR
jgi:hypothetical protein